jgi:hypothetical protein
MADLRAHIYNPGSCKYDRALPLQRNVRMTEIRVKCQAFMMTITKLQGINCGHNKNTDPADEINHSVPNACLYVGDHIGPEVVEFL